MTRSLAGICCLSVGACQGVLGDVEVLTSRESAMPAPDPSTAGAGSMGPRGEAQPPPRGPEPIGAAPDGRPPVVGVPLAPSEPTSSVDAGPVATADAGPPPVVSTAIVAGGAAVVLPRIGVDGGEPHLGSCAGGVVIGVRATANPNEDTFGQRLTFIEPVCGTVLVEGGPAPSDGVSRSITVTRDDAIVTWAETDGFIGAPIAEVPDPRLVWVLQPAALCPESAPVLVGLSGEYDPVAPDVTNTAAIRSVVIECAPLVIADDALNVVAAAAGHQLIANADSFATEGTDTFRSACEDGAVTTQIQVHAGFWLDGFALGCSTLRASE